MSPQTGRAVPWDAIEERRRDQAAKAPGVPRDVSACKSDNCRAAIRFGVTVDNKRIPVDFAPDPGGNLVRVMVAQGDWRIRVLTDGEEPAPGTHRWTSHYATCPDAAKFRNAGRGRRGAAAGPELAAVAALAPLGPTTVTTPPPPPVEAPRPGTLLAIDGNSLAHRAWYAGERTGMATPDGRPIFAVHGFLRMLAGIIDRTGPDALVVGFDDRDSSVRRDRHPDYKAGRAEKNPDLYEQMGETADVLRQLGVQVVTPAGLEADDVLGSAAAAAEAAGWQCIVATSDKDAFGLITEATTMLRLMDGLDNAVRMTPDKLLEKCGVTPAQYPDYAALVGDKSDNLAGVNGIGEKTAVKLLAALGSVAAALADPAAAAAAIGKAYAGKLTTDDAAAALERNWDLMAIRRDVPVDVDACRPTVTPATVAEVLRGRHLPGLVDRLTAALCQPPAPSSPPAPRQRGHLPVVPDPAPPAPAGPELEAPPLVPTDPPPVCPDCGRPGAAVLPLAHLDGGRPALTGEEVLVDREHLIGDLAAVLVGDVWAVRRIPVGEYPPGARRRSHHCITYPHQCSAPGCGKPARMYPAGALCDEHPPPPSALAWGVQQGEPRATT